MQENIVRLIRVNQGLSQSRLVRLVEVPESQLCAVERGRLHPWPKLRRRLAEQLQVPEDVLFPGTAEKTNAGK